MKADMDWQMNEFRRHELAQGDGANAPAEGATAEAPKSREALTAKLKMTPREIKDFAVYIQRAAKNGTTVEAEQARDQQPSAARKTMKVGRKKGG